jgi:hypothetical protein
MTPVQENEHITNLIAARDKEVADRCDVASALAAAHQRGHPDDLREAIVRIQSAIEAIDRAFADERQLANVPTSGAEIGLSSQHK